MVALGAAALALSSSASAQTNPTDYDFNFAPLANNGPTAYIGSAIFSAASGGPAHYPGPGDAIRRCYSVDVTQGGRNQSGNYEFTRWNMQMAFGANDTVPGLNFGLTSMQSASDSDLGGDSCMSPWAASTGNTGGHAVGFSYVPGNLGGAPWPNLYNVTWSFGASSTFTGVGGPNVLGTEATGSNPLLANVIYEIQGPATGGAINQQYYLGTTDENTGLGLNSAVAGRGTGGVTNGNSDWGLNVYGVGAATSGAVSHTRVLGFDPTTGTLGGGPILGPNAELNFSLAFSTPFLWAENNGSVGAGGPDWNVATGTPSQAQVWLKDIKSGSQSTPDVDWKAGGGGVAGANNNPFLIINQGFFLWSATPAIGMQQQPMSWDTLGGVLPPQAGSYVLSTLTTREGLNQRLHANYDTLMAQFLQSPGLTFGTKFTPATSYQYDTVANGAYAEYEGVFTTAPVESGISKLQINGGNPFPVVPTANPSFGGINLGVHALTLQIDATVGVLDLVEMSSALTITLQ